MSKITAIVTVLPINTLKDIQDLKSRAGRVSTARREANSIKESVSDTVKRTRVTKDYAPLASESVQDKHDVVVAAILEAARKNGLNMEAMLLSASALVVKTDKKAA